MSKAIIVVDFAYKSAVKSSKTSGKRGLRNALKYFQFRDSRNNVLAKEDRVERWQDRGLGVHHREILENCQQMQSPHVLAWTWVISPDPELMAHVPEKDRRELVCDLTERIVEDYYLERGYDIPTYSYVLHSRQTNDTEQEQLHTHIVLPGTVEAGVERLPMYNNASKKHDVLFREIAAFHFEKLLEAQNIDWQRVRELQQPDLPFSDLTL